MSKVVPVIIEPVQGYTTSLDIEDTLNITCKAKGNPSPNITWIKNSTREIVAASTTNSKQLTITPMKEEDFGVYSCIASNNLASTEVSVDIIKGMFADTMAYTLLKIRECLQHQMLAFILFESPQVGYDKGHPFSRVLYQIKVSIMYILDKSF